MRYLRQILLFLAAIAAVGGRAQITVRDSLTKEPVPYASVYFGNKTGGYTDDAGTLVIPAGTRRIRVSHICYETQETALADLPDRTVWLVPKRQSLGEISVSAKAPRRMKTERVGLVQEKTRTQHRGANGFEMALYIPYDSTWTEAPYIQSVLASLDYSTRWLLFTVVSTPQYATLRFDLRLPDAETGAPGEESIIGGGILCPPDRKVGKEGVRLPTPVPFPETGVFVVVEWITTAAVSESQNLIPALNMTSQAAGDRTWNKKTFLGMGWMREQDEPVYQDESIQVIYKGRTPSAQLGVEITKGGK